MTIFVSYDPEPEQFEPPSYSDRGRILINVLGPGDGGPYCGRYELVVHGYDADSAVMWLEEGIGIEYWINEDIEIWIPGWYVIEGVHGVYTRGDGWTTDDDEDWYYDEIRPATSEEVTAQCLIGPRISSAAPTTSPSAS